MKPLEILQGKWLGHPLHPALVHVPIGAWFAATVLDLLTWAGSTHGGPGRLALYLAAAGLIVALIAIPPGLADWLPIKPGKPARRLGVYHLLLNLAAIGVWTANLLCRLRAGIEVTIPVLLTSCAGSLLVLVSGYIGSLMVFDQGTSVARLSKEKWRHLALTGGAQVPPEK